MERYREETEKERGMERAKDAGAQRGSSGAEQSFRIEWDSLKR